MQRLRMGLVGAGPWASTVHAAAIAAHPVAELAGVWARRSEAAAAVADGTGARVHATFDELVADVDAVAFAVPPAVQGELAPRAVAAGRHVVLEKPLAADLAAAEGLERAVADAGVVSTVVLTLRYDAAVRAWIAALPTGPAGPDTVGVGRWFSGALLGGPFAASAWRVTHGALLDVGPHVIDLLDLALGRVQGVDWAHRYDDGLWAFGLAHQGGARSSVSMSLRVATDPTEFEVAMFGGAGRYLLTSRPEDATVPYSTLLDEFVADVAAGRTDGPCSAARGLHLQRITEQVSALAG
ncbi:Gfo/Idh/MocA family protein [Pseudonocardia benzenivorans]|uniref:Oxidoreductase domain protein n=2 Tax=Pseudonocardia TaxID=1847 RepID=F4CV46_PSEUX|nr:Gfo/Idh/MocA family oxidoreductase [Pseudonocardia dioxanivorans]AEA28592.1 oxidoreductase domain protein [Pseudonocardia dioxanivorans CB1190]GJF03587.1 dehydrogenase [Pseudonocardia sp. D17]